MNWSLMSNGAWDYPADTRGYTIGSMQELTMHTWSLRTVIVLERTEANGPTLDTRIAKNRGEAVEWEQRYKPFGHAGALRVLGFLNREDAGTFREALLQPGVPDLGPTRRSGAKKYGFGLNLEQELTRDLGAFARYGWSDGKTETWAFTQIDRSVSGGVPRRAASGNGPPTTSVWPRCATISPAISPLPGRRRPRLHHRRWPPELRARIDPRSLLRLARH